MENPAYTGHTIAHDYLTALGVPHTEGYTDRRFAGMPFHTLFGLTRLLEEYGVKSEGYSLADKGELLKLRPPFLAQTDGGLVIVTAAGSDGVGYMTQGVAERIPFEEFEKVWNGNVLLSIPAAGAKEPDYGLHARLEFFMRAKKWVLALCVAFLLAYFYISRQLYLDVWATVVAVVDIFGLYMTYLLVQKSVNIHSAAADRVCGVLQEGGCDKILATGASKFFGLFGWSEVGFSYFSVSLLALLLFPSTLPALALCNICCLPFTVWSIWYQGFRAHHWCTLCVCVQGSLWLLFFSYLFGGRVAEAFPPTLTFVVLGAAYVGVMLGINAVMGRINS